MKKFLCLDGINIEKITEKLLSQTPLPPEKEKIEINGILTKLSNWSDWSYKSRKIENNINEKNYEKIKQNLEEMKKKALNQTPPPLEEGKIKINAILTPLSNWSDWSYKPKKIEDSKERKYQKIDNWAERFIEYKVTKNSIQSIKV